MSAFWTTSSDEQQFSDMVAFPNLRQVRGDRASDAKLMSFEIQTISDFKSDSQWGRLLFRQDKGLLTAMQIIKMSRSIEALSASS